jgi:hypothetical protein
VNLTREQAEEHASGREWYPNSVLVRALADQLLATMDALTTAEADVLRWTGEAANYCCNADYWRQRTTTAEARIEAALAIVTSENCHQPVNVAAILRGDHDTKGERL